MKKITIKDVEYIAFRLAQELLELDEPIPRFSTRFPHVLESCVSVPFAEFFGKKLYPSILSKASILFYLMIKNHPFQNGNKRIAVTTLFVFLYKNKKWLKVDTYQLYQFTVWIASSPAQLKNEVVKSIESFLRLHLVNTNSKSGLDVEV
ncbi:type II toxin-antitoxin system death-on-curing family toxin [Candidatus Aerophobetes bacterium]|nr:type II toxin-antitoxin system death-on-curing family toxin [Candidatus Aerophobetes bacterium]